MAVLQRRASDVYITEQDLSQILLNSSTAAAALVGVSSQGPIKPTLYTNANDFIADWGIPNAKVSFDHYAALDYFREGNALYACRAVGTGYSHSAVVVKKGATGDSSISAVMAGIEDPDNPDWNGMVSPGEEALFILYAKKGPGSYGDNYAVRITSTNLGAPLSLAGNSASVGGSLADGSYKYVVSALSVDGESVASSPATVVISGGSNNALINLTWQPVPGAIGYVVYREVGANYEYLETVGSSFAGYTDDGAIGPDPSRNPHLTPSTQGVPSQRFVVDIFDTSWSTSTPRESFECSLNDELDETGSQMEVSSRLNPFSNYVSCRVNATYTGDPVMRSSGIVSFTGGASGATPLTSDINAKWNLFRDKEQYVVDVLINAGRTSLVVQRHMEELARTRGDCVAFLDVPPTKQKASAALDYRNIELNLNSSYAALFTSDLRESDPITGKILYVPSSGYMAALYARTCRNNAPWFSIAALNRGILNVLDIRENYDEGQATQLARAQVNYHRKFVGRDIALWEQFTLQNKTTALQFLNVRFLCNTLKRAMYNYLLYGLQEPNDPILRKQLEVGLRQYLDTVVVGRGIARYDVHIGEDLNTPAYVNSGILRIAIVIVPRLPVQEIQLTLVLSKEGITLSESEIASL